MLFSDDEFHCFACGRVLENTWDARVMHADMLREWASRDGGEPITSCCPGCHGINGGASGADQLSVVDGESETEKESDDEFGRDSNGGAVGDRSGLVRASPPDDLPRP